MRDEVVQMAEIFKAFGDPTRLKIIKILASKMARDIRVADIADMLGVSQPAVSQHLKILKSIGVLDSQREGTRIIYNINVDIFKKYKELVDTTFELAFTQCGSKSSCNEKCKKECSEANMSNT